ncbi:hypothetical protein [Kineosporia succinea]|uniref:Peptidase C-terminal archaeal/bacterial domain-containing protein n=1 Tax=Kineosporia succinea TaxID=84632 RepID=A0ABT9PED6_9ACTN|nr:hypothetical protein [Kineosporia succinea]MDP9830851.1 hypothetical protein [Kineosporia succinea]
MNRRLAQHSAVAALGVLTALTFAAAPARAAEITCAPDPHEIDDPALGVGDPVVTASIAVGGTASRAICQTRDPLPGKHAPQDVDYIGFTATQGQAYTVDLVAAGSGLTDPFVGFLKLNDDGSTTSAVQSSAYDGRHSTTVPLDAGRYAILVADGSQEGYPDHVLGTKTIQGEAGTYTVKLSASAPPPVLKSVKITPNPVKGGDSATATLTFTGPILPGGTTAPLSSSNAFVAGGAGSLFAPEGATTLRIPIRTGRVSQDTPVTFSAWVTGVGPTLSTQLTVRR